MTGTGTVSASVDIEVSQDGVNVAATPISLGISGTTTDSVGDLIDAPWPYVRANVTAISGTSASVDVRMGG